METSKAIEAFLLDRKAGNLSPRTVDWYRHDLERFARANPELPEQPQPIREFLGGLSGEDETKHGYFRAIHALYTFVQQEWGFPLSSRRKRDDANPMKRVRAPRVRPKVMRSLSMGQLHTLLNSRNGHREHKWQLRDQAIARLISDTAVRVSEAVLTWDVIGEESVIVNGKTGENEPPLSPETRQLLARLREWNDANFGPSPYVFLGKKGPLTAQGIQKAVRRAFKRAGLQGRRCGPHTLRHTFGRNWIAAGGDSCTLQDIMGVTMPTVRRYVALSREERIRQHRRFSPLRQQASLAQGTLWQEGSEGA